MVITQKEKLAALKGDYLANLARLRQAGNLEQRDRAIPEHVSFYVASVGNDRETGACIPVMVARTNTSHLNRVQ